MSKMNKKGKIVDLSKMKKIVYSPQIVIGKPSDYGVSNHAIAICRNILSPLFTRALIVLTNLSTVDNIEDVLQEEYLHYVLAKHFGIEVTKQLDNIMKYVECTDEEFNYLKLLRFLSKNSNTILRRKNGIDYDNIFWELEDDIF